MANSAAYVELLFIGILLYTVRGSFVVFQEVLEKATSAMWCSQEINMSFAIVLQRICFVGHCNPVFEPQE